MFFERLEDIEIPKSITGRVVIKLHMGEAGNTTHISPEEVRIVFDKIKANGGEPFLFDTTTLYEHKRYTKESYMQVARDHGFGDFPVVIGSDDDVITVDGYGIPRELKVDAMLVLSHGKGHIFTAFGGAVKNIGMGCVNKAGKRRMHNPNQPKHISEKCIKCGACMEACSDNFLHMNDEGEIEINHLNCAGCGQCVKACPTGAMVTDEDSVEKSFTQFAVGAKAVLSLFPGDKVFCITALRNITERCDCAPDPGKIVCPDIGYLAGTDPVELDAEAVRMIKEKAPDALEFKVWELFEKASREIIQGQKTLSEF